MFRSGDSRRGFFPKLITIIVFLADNPGAFTWSSNITQRVVLSSHWTLLLYFCFLFSLSLTSLMSGLVVSDLVLMFPLFVVWAVLLYHGLRSLQIYAFFLKTVNYTWLCSHSYSSLLGLYPNESKRNRPYYRSSWKNRWGDGPFTPKTYLCPWQAQWAFVSYAKPSPRGSHRDISALSMQTESPRTSIVLDQDTNASQTWFYLF